MMCLGFFLPSFSGGPTHLVCSRCIIVVVVTLCQSLLLFSQALSLEIPSFIIHMLPYYYYRKSTLFQLPLLVSLFRNDLAFPIRRLSCGDYAGYHVTYDMDGTHIPIPAHYVPPALLEWGQVPLALEVIVSEQNDVRQILTVLPETGCGNDNLEVLKRREELGELLWQATDACVYVSQSSSDTTTSRIECIFAVGESRRSRVVLSCDGVKLKMPVSLYLERQISETSTEGRRADGGGLDARSVSEWIGSELRSIESSLNAKICPTWTFNAHNVFGLPGNLTVAFDNKQDEGLTVWVGHTYEQQSRLIELQNRENEWIARSWLEGGENERTGRLKLSHNAED